MTLRLLLDHLGLHNVTLVCHDIGGPVGLSVVKEMPEVFSRLVVMNTFLPVGTEYTLFYLKNLAVFTAYRNLVSFLDTYFPIYYLFKFLLIHQTKDILKAYVAPFPSGLYKVGAVKWCQLIPLSTRTPVAWDMQTTRDFLAAKWKRPALIMYSDKDFFTRGHDALFQTLMPHASNKTVVGAGHFLQEDKGEELAVHITSFIDGKL